MGKAEEIDKKIRAVERELSKIEKRGKALKEKLIKIDGGYEVDREVTQFDNKSERLVTSRKLKDFDLTDFRKHFNVKKDDPLLWYCYEIKNKDEEFIRKHLSEKVKFNFQKYSYFLEVRQVEKSSPTKQ